MGFVGMLAPFLLNITILMFNGCAAHAPYQRQCCVRNTTKPRMLKVIEHRRLISKTKLFSS